MNDAPMNTDDYEFLCDFLIRSSGLSLGPNKEYLINSRLKPVAKSLDMEDVAELIAELRVGANASLRKAVMEAMTTNETSFFRDKKPFEDLKNVILPDLIEQRQVSRRLRIWSAAASTGQEAYSIAMTLADDFPELMSWRLEIVGTDIDTKALERASEGLYSQFEVQRGLPIQCLAKYFNQVPGGWQIKPELRERVTWQQLNLLDDFSALGPFDLIFCRNVLIYFETDAKRSIMRRLSQVLRPEGYVIFGAAETVFGNCQAFTGVAECQSGVYRPVAPASALV